MGTLPKEIRKALLNNRGQFKKFRIDSAMRYAKENNLKVYKKDIAEYITKIDNLTEKRVNFGKTHKTFVNPFLGGFVADIGYNRNPKAGENLDGLFMKYFLLIVHGNSGWATAYQLDNKSRNDIRKALEHFTSEMKRKYNYPVTMILTDNDKSFPQEKHIPINKIQAEFHRTNAISGKDIEHQNHRLFTRIDSFMSALRRYAANVYNKSHNSSINLQGNSHYDELYIPYDVLQEFIHEWNQHTIPNVKCTREEMMRDPDLEKAFICMALYANRDKARMRDDPEKELAINSEVTLRPRKKVFGNKQMYSMKQRPGTYTIIKTADGQYVGENTRQPGDVVYFRPDDVRSIVNRDLYDVERIEVAEASDPINNPMRYENEVVRVRDIQGPEKPSAVERARQMLYKDTFDNGIAHDMSPRAIYEQANKIDRADEIEENNKSHPMNVEITPHVVKNLSKAAISKILDHLIEQAKKDPYWHQDVLGPKSEQLADLVKKRNIRKNNNLENGRDRPNKTEHKENNRPTKQTVR